jgi:catechol 2,3-dioxygenase-like lactoylglutathione lyase family enzyme
MFAQINHMAMISPNWPMMAKFYEAVFGLRPSQKVSRPTAAVSVGDGYVGLNINPLRDGYVGGLDHFGMKVESIELTLERMQKKFPKANIVKRPSTRPFAQYSGHDPDGNIFDLAERTSKLNDVYAEADAAAPEPDCYLNKFAIRTLNAEHCAEFYAEVFALDLANGGPGDGWSLTDGRVTLAILPWSIPVFEGMSIKRPGPDHIGFKVRDLPAFSDKVRTVAESNPYLAPMPLGGSTEANARRDFFKKSASGKLQIADPGGIWIDVTD